MPNRSKPATDRSEAAASSGDSPKPHGDKLASARQAAAGSEVRDASGRTPADPVPSGDSPKPHGDKLAHAMPRTASPKEGQKRSD